MSFKPKHQNFKDKNRLKGELYFLLYQAPPVLTDAETSIPLSGDSKQLTLSLEKLTLNTKTSTIISNRTRKVKGIGT
jgi:hypothetical protein